jgi:type IV secretory pathway TraG/TraD family ATPase VirD4
MMRTRHADAPWGRGGACLALILYLCAAPAFAQVPDATVPRIKVQAASASPPLPGNPAAFLSQMPEPGRVIADMRGSDNLDTAARQVAALNRLIDVVVVLSGTADAPGGPRLTREELALNGRYAGASSSLATTVYLSFDPDNKHQSDANAKRNQWNRVRERYGEDNAFISALLQRYLTPDLRDKYLGHIQQVRQTRQTPKPAQGKVAKADTPADAYERDVEQAADLQSQESQVAKRVLNKEIDGVAYTKTMKALNGSLIPLKEKWQAAGRGTEFERDYMKRVTAMAVAQADKVSTAKYSRAIHGFLVLLVIAVIGGIYLLITQKPVVPPVSDVYGTAHYAPLETHVVDESCLARGLFFGKSSTPELATLPLDAPGAPVCSTPEHHTLIVARTRTGKGTRVIVPTLLCYDGSAFVIDPKGENTAVTARVRRDQLHQNIHILNPWNELGDTFPSRKLAPATYNPLDILVRSDPNAVAIAQALSAAICPAPANAKDRFWQGSAANVLTAVFLWLADRAEERKTLARAREIVSLSRREFTEKYLVPMAASEAFSGAIREMAAPFIDLAAETYSGIMSNLSESTKFLSDPQVKAATATSSFSMEDLATRKTTVYVVIPTERMDTQRTWLRLVVAAAMHTFKRPRKRTDSHHRCLFLIDEFAALGRVDDMPRDIATMGGFGVDFALVVQGLDQLKDHYGEARGTILSNCAYKWFCNLNDLDSAKYLSDTLGKKTVVTTSNSDSWSASTGGRNSSRSSSESTTHGETGRSLLNPDEILNLGRDVAITIQPNGHPQYLRPVDYWNLTKAFGYLRQEHPSLYWQPPLIYDENPYVAPPPPPPPPPGSDGHGARSKEKARSEPSPHRTKMTEDEAREILGVKAGATIDEIRTAYLHLMSKVHPDHGGSNYFAKELNAAKAVLMGE